MLLQVDWGLDKVVVVIAAAVAAGLEHNPTMRLQDFAHGISFNKVHSTSQ